jgi:hypothetical protein
MRVMNVNWHDVFQSGRVFWGQAIYWIITKHYNGDAGDLDRAERDLIVSSLGSNPCLQAGRGFSRFFVHRLSP